MKITKIVVVILLGVLLIYGLACCPAQTGVNVYSKYGFSFEYPHGVSIVEEGVYSATADDNSGMVAWVAGDGFYGISWEKMGIWNSGMAELSIDAIILDLESVGGVVELIGENVTAPMSGLNVTYQIIKIVDGEESNGEVNGIIAEWRCEQSAKILGAVFFVNITPRLHLENFLATFRCQ